MFEVETLIPVKFDGWDHIDTLIIALYDVEFIEDFGEFKQGEKFQVVDINYEEGIVEAYDEEGDLIVKSQKFTCIPTK